MSLMGAARIAAKRDDPSASTQPQDKWRDQLIRLVPTEAVAFFTGLIALAVGFEWGWEARWGIFAAIGIASLFWIYFNYWDTLTSDEKKARKLPMPYWALTSGTVAYIAWAATIPETPFLQWHKWDLKFAPFVTAGVVILLPIVDRVVKAYKERHPRPRVAHQGV